MAGNKYKHGKGWPSYGREHGKNAAANYKPRKRGPAQIPAQPRDTEVQEEAVNASSLAD